MLKTIDYLEKANISNYLSSIFLKDKHEFDFNYISKSTEDTKAIGYELAKYLKKGDIISLNGELGTGKTVFLAGIASFYNIEEEVSSPTFTIVNEYDTPLYPIFHFDVYRLENSDDFLEGIGTDYFYNGLCLIEWGNIIADILPKNTIHIDISKDELDENTRYFHVWRN